jgi:hypothetical protein
MMIFRVDHGESVNWVAIMYFQLVKELIRWDKCQKNMIKGTTKKRSKKKKMPFYHNPRSFISEVVSIRRSRITREEETSKMISRGQKKKRQYEGEVH